MKWLRRFLSDYAQVIIAMLIAGAIMGSCRPLPTPAPAPEPEPMMRVRACRDSQPIRLMPNWIKDWDAERPERQA